MRAVVQRVSKARVTVGDETVGEIGPGLCVLLAAGPQDDDLTATRLAERVGGLRVMADADARMNLDLAATEGSILVISQFTLYGDASRGHRPSFVKAAPADLAERLYQRFIDTLRGRALTVATGRFGAYMTIEMVNDGPVTLVLTSGEGPWPADAG